MANPTKEELCAMIVQDMHAKLEGKPEPVLHRDFTAMAEGIATRRVGMIRDGLAWMRDYPDTVAFNGDFKKSVATGLLNGMSQTFDDLYVGQFGNDFTTTFGAFCSKVMGHLDTLEERPLGRKVGAELKARFLAVVTAPVLKREELELAIERIQEKLTSHFMSDERGEITKAHGAFDKALELGLLDRIDYTPYSAPVAAVEVQGAIASREDIAAIVEEVYQSWLAGNGAEKVDGPYDINTGPCSEFAEEVVASVLERFPDTEIEVEDYEDYLNREGLTTGDIHYYVTSGPWYFDASMRDGVSTPDILPTCRSIRISASSIDEDEDEDNAYRP